MRLRVEGVDATGFAYHLLPLRALHLLCGDVRLVCHGFGTRVCVFSYCINDRKVDQDLLDLTEGKLLEGKGGGRGKIGGW